MSYSGYTSLIKALSMYFPAHIIMNLLKYFSDLPPDVDSFGVTLFNAAKKKQPLGHIVIHFSKLVLGKSVDEWYCVTVIMEMSFLLIYVL